MTNVQKEIWKDVIGYEGLYQVSTFGRIKGLLRKVKRGNHYITIPQRIINEVISYKGYCEVRLAKSGSKNPKVLHRIVALHFIPNPHNKPQVNHIDGNKLNNCVSNLEWVTNQENIDHSWKIGLRSKDISERSKLRSIEILDTETGIFYNSIKEVSFSLGKRGKKMDSCYTISTKKSKMQLYLSNRFIKLPKIKRKNQISRKRIDYPKVMHSSKN